MTHTTPTALITGGSEGLGLALVRALSERGWHVVTDARDGDRLAAAHDADPLVRAIAGDVTDPAHRADLFLAVGARLDLLVHGASTLGPLPLRTLADLRAEALTDVLAVNVVAPHALTRALLAPLHAADGTLVAISSDAGVEHYPTWGGYGASKAALDHLVLTTGAEERLTAYAVDPGDLRTRMHQDAFPGEDISDRPLPDTVVPRLLALIDARPPSGRYRAADLAADRRVEQGASTR